MAVDNLLPTSLSRATLLEGVHAVMQVIRHPEKASSLLFSLTSRDRGREDAELALRIVREIERIEGKDFVNIPHEKLETYSDHLAGLVMDRVTDDLRSAGISGDEALNAMRFDARLQFL